MTQMISMRDMIKAGVHFGHQARYWNPKMAPYIFTERHKVHIIDLEQTVPMFKEAINYMSSVVAKQGKILFVGTKRAAQQVIAEEATRAGMPYVNHRWLGGMLTNYKTVRQSIKRLKELEQMEQDGILDTMIKKEALTLRRRKEKLERSFGGIKNLVGLPDVIFTIDSNHESIAIKEAKRLNIPVVSIVDTNSDPDGLDYIIPGNDDATRAIRVYLKGIVDAIVDAKAANTVPSADSAEEDKKIEVKEKKNMIVKKKAKADTEEPAKKAEAKEDKKPVAKKANAKTEAKEEKKPAAKKPAAKKEATEKTEAKAEAKPAAKKPAAKKTAAKSEKKA